MTASDQPELRFAVCIRNDEYPASLEVRKVYQVVADTDAEQRDHLRVVDESGEDYVYPADYFIPIALPEAAAKALRAAS